MNNKLENLEGIIRHSISLCTYRYQAYQYAKEGTPEYSIMKDFCIEATQYLNNIHRCLEKAQEVIKELKEP